MVDYVGDDVGPEPGVGFCGEPDSDGALRDDTDGPFGDGVEVVVVRRARSVVNPGPGSVLGEGVGHESALAI